MTKTLAMGLTLLLSGCSHAYISQADRETVTACCPSENLICTESKLKDLAVDRCGGPVSLEASGSRGTGDIDVRRNVFGGQISGLSEKKEKCELFKCEERNPAAK